MQTVPLPERFLKTKLSVDRFDIYSSDRRESRPYDASFLATEFLKKELSNGRSFPAQHDSYARDISHLPASHRRRFLVRIAGPCGHFYFFLFYFLVHIPSDPWVKGSGHFNRGRRLSRV